MALRLESSALLAEVILGTAVEELALMRLQREVAGEIEDGLAQVRWWARHGWMDGWDPKSVARSHDAPSIPT